MMNIRFIPWAMLICSVAAASPLEAQPLDYRDARHLLNRAGLGASPQEIASFEGLSRRAAVSRLLEGIRTAALSAPPAWVGEPAPDPGAIRRLSREEKKERRELMRERGVELQAWWYREMLGSDSPLTERMTLFWHNHFTSDLRKAKRPVLMYKQNGLLRRHALGNFRELLHRISKDPAMILYLDNQTNKKGHPNENFARELLELFTLGEGHYSEDDIKEAARAFTGWQVNRRSGKFRFRRRQHDSGEKVFMGQRGRFGGEDIIDIVLGNPRVSAYIVEKLWREFISPAPPKREVDAIAARFRRSGYDIKVPVRALLESEHFWDESNRGVLIKSPVELMVGTLRTFELPLPDERALVGAGRRLGQEILQPPNVKGWPGGAAWITSATLLIRQELLERFLRGREIDRRAKHGDQRAIRMKQRMLQRMGKGGKKMVSSGMMGAMGAESWVDRETDAVRMIVTLLAAPAVHRYGDKAGADLVRSLVADPAYQLK